MTMSHSWWRTTSLRLAEMCAWLVAAGIVLLRLLNAPPNQQADLVRLLSLLVLLHGIRVFLGHGGARVTSLGLFNASLALCAGVGGFVNSSIVGVQSEGRYLAAAVVLSFVAQVLITFFAWKDKRENRPPPATFPSISDCRWITGFGAAALATALAVFMLGLDIPVLGVENVAFPAIVLMAIGLWFRPHTAAVSLSTPLVLGGAVAYAVVLHSGPGRLRIVALFFALSMLFTARYPRLLWKFTAVGAAPAGLWWLAQARLSLQESLNRGGSEGRTGLESMTDSVLVLGQVIHYANSGGDLGFGLTFITLPLALLPSAWTAGWAHQAIGYELVKIADPAKYNTGYSVASTYLGEWIFDFALMGVVFAIPLVVLGLRYLHQGFSSAMARVANGREAMLWLAFWVMLCGGIADFTWDGQHILGARFLYRLPFLFALYVLVRLSRRGQQRRRPSHHTARRGSPPAVHRS
jgi:hypothetical protein